MSKREKAIQYMESLPINERTSVRSLAEEMSISEGTAYRAIKEAEERGIVSTIERVGTIRIEQRTKQTPDMLTYGEIVKIIDGEVLGGHNGLDRSLNKFIIGAMEKEAISRYLSENSLLIVGNRENVQRVALEAGVAVLITGGFKASDEIIKLANERQLPLISTSYDTFSVATIINRSITDQAIKKDIVTVEDIYTPIEETSALKSGDTVKDFHRYAQKTGLSRFPVHSNGRLIGVVTAKDLIGKSEGTLIERAMTKDNLVTVQKHASVASVSYTMIWEDIEMIPVVSDNLELEGVVSRQDIMKSIQSIQQQPQMTNTYEDELLVHLEEVPKNIHGHNYKYRVNIEPYMINNLGTLSYGVLVEFITYIAKSELLRQTGFNSTVEKIDLHYFTLIQLGNEINFSIEILNQTRRSALVQINIYHENTLVGTAILTCQIIERAN